MNDYWTGFIHAMFVSFIVGVFNELFVWPWLRRKIGFTK